MTEPNVIGERIKYLRLERGMTQADVADASGLSRSVVARCEADGHYASDENRLAKLAAALRVDPSYIAETERRDDEPATYELTMRNIYGHGFDLRIFARYPRALTENELQLLHGLCREYARAIHVESHPNWEERDVAREAAERFETATGLHAEFVQNPVTASLSF